MNVAVLIITDNISHECDDFAFPKNNPPSEIFCPTSELRKTDDIPKRVIEKFMSSVYSTVIYLSKFHAGL